MKFSFVKQVAAVAATCAIALTVVSADAEAKKVRWKMHSAFGTNLAVIGPVGPRISGMIKDMSDGDFDVKVFEPGALAGGYAYYDPVSQGAIDAAYGTPGANQGKNAALAFLSTWPFGPGALEFNAWLRYGGGIEIGKEIYAKDGMNYFYCGMIPPETSGWFRKPINSLDELKGLKMRFFGMGALVMQKFGVSTQQLAGGDIYPALELGTIDATEFAMPAIDRSLGFYQIAKYNYFPGWHQQATMFELLINKDTWNGMEKDQQAALETLCLASMTNSIAEGEAMQFEAMQKAQEQGVELRYWNEEMLNLFESTWLEVVEEQKKDPYFAKVWADMSDFRKNYQIWESKGFLPRG